MNIPETVPGIQPITNRNPATIETTMPPEAALVRPKAAPRSKIMNDPMML
jgi:hypothetical protein